MALLMTIAVWTIMIWGVCSFFAPLLHTEDGVDGWIASVVGWGIGILLNILLFMWLFG